ncbi:hypothetical protein LSAT2_027252 [Lamellibrachia satsuma]|nr:hypothetical protein LSAT2_027252 [Lamellibrachia satsuma]
MLSFVGQLECLTCLSFQDNCLSVDGVRKLTCPSRVLARGPSNLHILDLSANPLLTNDALRYLLHFKMLEILDLSGTKISKLGVKKLEEKSLLRVDAAAVADVEKTFSGVSMGWAADTITRLTDSLQCQSSDYHGNTSATAKFCK